MYHNETWHDYCYMQYLCLYHIETYYNEMYQKENYMYYIHEMRDLAIRFFNLSFKKQLVIGFMIYLSCLLLSIISSIVNILYIFSSF